MDVSISLIVVTQNNSEKNRFLYGHASERRGLFFVGGYEMKKSNKSKSHPISIGGQALIEGVMMQGGDAVAMSVRTPDGKIVTEAKRKKPTPKWMKIPVVRGVVSFVSSLVTGTDCIMKSSQQAFPEEETPSVGATIFATFLGVIIAVAAFMLLPSFLSSLISDYIIELNVLAHSLIEGCLRIVLFVLYLLLVSKMSDIRRTFMYHGAEHRTINCFESGDAVIVENAQKCSTRHNRCGTTFLFFVMTVSILVFSLISWLVQLILGYMLNKWLLMLIRLLCLPLVAGLSYELLRFLAKYPNNKVAALFRAPGLALQRLTTFKPDDDMTEVAIKAFTTVLKMNEDPSYPEREFGEYVVSEVREEISALLESRGKDVCDGDWIICFVTGLKRGMLGEKRIIDKESYAKICEMLERRLNGEPLDYIIGESEFYGMKFFVNENVLIPRPETELLCEIAIKEIGEKKLTVLDLMTGSGCIAGAIKNNTNATVVASDVSEEALKVARVNLISLGAETVKSDVFKSLEDRTFDLIVSNPPYIVTNVIETLQEEVQKEPFIALDGGEDGLRFYREIANQSPARLNEGGMLLLEIGYDQADAVCSLLNEAFCEITVIKDLEGHDRIIKARKK